MYSITHHLVAGVAVGHVGPLSWIFVFLERKLTGPGNVSHVKKPASVVPPIVALLQDKQSTDHIVSVFKLPSALLSRLEVP